MKFETTQKAMKQRGCAIWQIGYCDAQALLADINPCAYNAGVYGWNCDYYYVGHDIIICTGYRPHGIGVNARRLDKYESLARHAKREDICGIREKWIIEEIGE